MTSAHIAGINCHPLIRKGTTASALGTASAGLETTDTQPGASRRMNAASLSPSGAASRRAKAWEYVLSVMAGLLWPRRRLTGMMSARTRSTVRRECAGRREFGLTAARRRQIDPTGAGPRFSRRLVRPVRPER